MRVLKGKPAVHFAGADGTYIGAFEPPLKPGDAGAVPVPSPPPGPAGDHRWTGAGWELTEAAELRQVRRVALQHRLDRKEDYKTDLADEPENDFVDTIGDCLDALFKDAQMRRAAGETLHPELVSKLDAWLAVKARHPAPEPEQ